MKPTEILEHRLEERNMLNWRLFLYKEMILTKNDFTWLKFNIDESQRTLKASGNLELVGTTYHVVILYSPFFRDRYDRIYIKHIPYNNQIHMYPDSSLCLYHPYFDKPAFHRIELNSIIPWISEWITFYEQWKIYGVWLGKEIKHASSKSV